MDKRLIEFCLALPPEQKYSQGITRRILRQAMAGILPEKVRCRTTKTDFTENFVHTLLAFERKKLDELLSTDYEVINTYLDMQSVNQACQRFTSREKVGDDDVMAVWKALNLALWLRYTGMSPV